MDKAYSFLSSHYEGGAILDFTRILKYESFLKLF